MGCMRIPYTLVILALFVQGAAGSAAHARRGDGSIPFGFSQQAASDDANLGQLTDSIADFFGVNGTAVPDTPAAPTTSVAPVLTTSRKPTAPPPVVTTSKVLSMAGITQKPEQLKKDTKHAATTTATPRQKLPAAIPHQTPPASTKLQAPPATTKLQVKRKPDGAEHVNSTKATNGTKDANSSISTKVAEELPMGKFALDDDNEASNGTAATASNGTTITTSQAPLAQAAVENKTVAVENRTKSLENEVAALKAKLASDEQKMQNIQQLTAAKVASPAEVVVVVPQQASATTTHPPAMRQPATKSLVLKKAKVSAANVSVESSNVSVETSKTDDLQIPTVTKAASMPAETSKDDEVTTEKPSPNIFQAVSMPAETGEGDEVAIDKPGPNIFQDVHPMPQTVHTEEHMQSPEEAPLLPVASAPSTEQPHIDVADVADTGSSATTAAPVDQIAPSPPPQRTETTWGWIKSEFLWLIGESSEDDAPPTTTPAPSSQAPAKSWSAQDSDRTRRMERRDFLKIIQIEDEWSRMENEDAETTERLHHQDQAMRSEAETPAQPHKLTRSEMEARGQLHSSNFWKVLEQQDNAIEQSLSSSDSLDQYNQLTRLQDAKVKAAVGQMDTEREPSQTFRQHQHHDMPFMTSDIHDPWVKLEADDGRVVKSIHQNPDLQMLQVARRHRHA